MVNCDECFSLSKTNNVYKMMVNYFTSSNTVFFFFFQRNRTILKSQNTSSNGVAATERTGQRILSV